MHKIRRLLDPAGEACPGELPPKPRRMHWRTYERHAARHDAYSHRWSVTVMRRFRLC